MHTFRAERAFALDDFPIFALELLRGSGRSAARGRRLVGHAAPCIAPVIAPVLSVIAPVFSAALSVFAPVFATFHSWGLSLGHCHP
jgi:hypothetical protein